MWRWWRGVTGLRESFGYRLLYRSLLQKRPVILTSLLVAATPYHVSNVKMVAGATCGDGGENSRG